MGQEVQSTDYAEADFATFTERLKRETALVQAWERDGLVSRGPTTAGFELEAWLVGRDLRPAPLNDAFLAAADTPLIVPELSKFNIEFNGEPEELTGRAISGLHEGLDLLWTHASETAKAMGLRIAMTGILPTVESADLTIANMSTGNRYHVLNQHVFRLRKGAPIQLSIDGREELHDVHRDVMLEAATTSFQIHLKVPPDRAVDYYNASKLASAPLVALAANSPFLFGKDLWAESRIPLFEQAVSVGNWDYSERVTFGVRFIEDMLSEVFLANRQRYPVLLPSLSERPPEKLDHLRLHNGTIWRWNRPLVGWDADGTPHFRIEQRVAPAGPTVTDSLANAAFYFGLVKALAEGETPPSQRCQFFTCRDNFYAAAKYGLEARLRWDHRDNQPVQRLILDQFLAMAAHGLDRLGIDPSDRDHYLGIIAARTETGQNGASWQRAHAEARGRDMVRLLSAYLDRQQEGAPVHLWAV